MEQEQKRERESSYKDKKATYVKQWFYSLHFASWIGYKVLRGKRWYYLKTSFLKALWKWFSNAASQRPKGSGFYTLLCLIAGTGTGKQFNTKT